MSTDIEKQIRIQFENSLWPVNPKGNKEKAFIEYRHAIFIEKAEPKVILAKWQEYNDMCTKEQRDSKYVKTFENFLKEKGWTGEYKAADGRTRSFVDSWLKGLLSFLHL